MQTTEGMSDDQARSRSTVSELTLGGLIKHVATTELEWARFIVDGPADGPAVDWESIDWSNPPPEMLEYQQGHTMGPGDTLADLLGRYEQIAAATDGLVGSVDLDAKHPLPTAPWFEAGVAWTNRRTLLHIVAETSQHAGHADIIREAIDGHRTMG